MGLLDKLFKKTVHLQTVDCVQRLDNYDAFTWADNSNRIELKDDFVDNYTFHQLWKFFENNNNDIKRGKDEPSPGNRVHPITPKFMVYEYKNPPKFAEIRKLMKKHEEIKIVEIEDVYPQFSRPCMRIEDAEGIRARIKSRNMFKRMKSILSCKSRQNSAHVFSSEIRVDESTTLHSLQGDIESDTGVPDPIRKLRHRRSGCY